MCLSVVVILWILGVLDIETMARFINILLVISLGEIALISFIQSRRAQKSKKVFNPSTNFALKRKTKNKLLGFSILKKS